LNWIISFGSSIFLSFSQKTDPSITVDDMKEHWFSVRLSFVRGAILFSALDDRTISTIPGNGY
jgi:hypothetical protein